MKSLLIKAFYICIWIYCGIAFFDPSDYILGVKLPFFALILFIFLMLNLFDRAVLPEDLLLRVIFIAFMLPAFFLGVFMVRHPGQSLTDGLSLVRGLWAIMLVLPVVAMGVDLRKPMFLCIGIMMLSIIGLQVCSAIDPKLYEKISIFLIDNSVALIGFRNFGELDLVMIFFVTTPLLVIPVPFLIGTIFGQGSAWGWRVGATIFLFLILLASFLSASRAVFFILLAECLTCFLVIVRHRPRLLAGALVTAAVFSLLVLLAIQRTSLLSAEEQSNTVKIAHYKSFLTFIDENPIVLLTGDGLGAQYYSNAPGINREVYQTELTYLDIIRYFGLA
ncbi:MAG: O-antigen ligase family protein, partial [Candidatus Edwardsbacteria bacterium]|nr:O-antigen ligase family protein [Candidatus Edwardsbacteria bacterium]